jgi:hypothetical protein
MKIAILAAATGFLVQCAAVLAATNDLPNTLTVDGVTYSNVTWGAVTPATVTIFHKTGVAAIPLEKLSADLQQRFGYDPKKATAYRESEQAALKTRLQQDAAKRAEETKRQAEFAAYEADCKTHVLVVCPPSEASQSGLWWVTKGSEKKTIWGQIEEKRLEGTVLRGHLKEDLPFIAMGRKDREILFVLNFFPTQDVGKSVEVEAFRTNPFGGMTSYYIGGKTPTFEEWRKIQGLIRKSD